MDPVAVQPSQAKLWRDAAVSLLAVAVVVLLYAGWTRPGPSTGAGAGMPGVGAPRLTTRIHDVGDLIDQGTAFYGSRQSAGPKGGFAPIINVPLSVAELRRACADELATVITTVTSAKWSDKGGTGVVIAGDRMIVTQTPGGHATVEDLLRLLRQGPPR